MKKQKLLIPGFIFTVIAAIAIIAYWPGDAGALNPNHISCATCHSLHTAPGQALANEAVVEVLCLSCHSPAGTATKKAEVHTNKSGSNYDPFTMTCTDCHSPHDNLGNHLGGTNLGQVGKSLDSTGYAMIPTPNSGNRYVVFNNRGSDADPPYNSSQHSFASGDEDGDGNYEGSCEVCHTQVGHHRNYDDGDPSHDHTHYVGQNCTVCHPHISNFSPAGGGSCDSCHSSIYNNDFTQTSHHVAGGTVTEADCGVCHQEPGSNHMDGNIDLKNPDTGNALTPFVKGATRNTSVLPEAWVISLQENFCLKCHDNLGATNTNISGNAKRPFSVGTRDVPDVITRFNSSSYHHAVTQAGTNTFCDTSTMESPWNQSGGHDKITCFDCHEFTGHGSANQRMLRTSVDLDSMEAGTLSTTIGTEVETFCTLCHISSEYVVGAANSKFEYHGANQNQHRAAGGNELGCLGCHGGIVDQSGISGNGSARGNIHGGGYDWLSNSWANGFSTDHFMVGGWNSGWKANTSSGKDGCGGGDCNHPGSTKRNTPGKEYTQAKD